MLHRDKCVININKEIGTHVSQVCSSFCRIWVDGLIGWYSTSLVPWSGDIRYPLRENLSQTWALSIWEVFYGIIGYMTKRYTQSRGKDFRCLCCYWSPHLRLGGLEPLLRVDVQKIAIELCATAESNLLLVTDPSGRDMWVTKVTFMFMKKDLTVDPSFEADSQNLQDPLIHR